MDSNAVIDGLIFFLGLIVLLTFHEYGHAWMALKCGDDTAKLQGRCSLNPLVHIDPIGTVVLPLMMIFLSPGVARFLVGWAKPVPVNSANFKNAKLDDILVSSTHDYFRCKRCGAWWIVQKGQDGPATLIGRTPPKRDAP